MSFIQLWPKQQQALEFALGRDCTALLCEQRTGKTYITLALWEHYMANPSEPLCGVMITILNNKESTWLDGCRKLLPDLPVFTDFEQFKKAKGHRMLFVHYDALAALIPRLCKYKHLNFAGVDEGHRISHRGTKQSKAVARLKWVRRKLLLTGTPIEKHPTDLFAQFRFLDPDVFGTNWESFEKRYMDYRRIDMRGIRPGSMAWETKTMQQRILKRKARFRERLMPEFIGLLKGHCYRLESSDVGIMPPVISKVVVPLLGRQRRAYEQMDKHQVLDLPDGQQMISALPVTTVMKKRQIASGFVYDEEGELHPLGNAKERKLVQLFRQLSKPVVIFTAFKPDTDTIYDRLRAEGYEVARVYGGTKKSLRANIWRDFQAARYDGIVCQIKTGGVGVDLWKANNAIVHSMGHSFIDWDQAKARLSAIGKTKPTNIFVLCGRNTVDEDMYSLVLEKHLTGQQVLKHLTRRHRHGKESRRN